jgi:hypothetical protein
MGAMRDIMQNANSEQVQNPITAEERGAQRLNLL